MTRAISILLVFVIGVPLVAPALALGSASDSLLPSCCRRNGAHHCMQSKMAEDTTQSATSLELVGTRCPMFPKAMAPSHHQTLSFQFASGLHHDELSRPAQLRQIEAWARIALAGARHKRGPPSVRPS